MAKSVSDDRGRDFSANRSVDEPVPGSRGRTMNRRAKDVIEAGETGEIAETPNIGATSGGTRSPKVLQKNRKTRRAA
jgi:hypothetical protein